MLHHIKKEETIIIACHGILFSNGYYNNTILNLENDNNNIIINQKRIENFVVCNLEENNDNNNGNNNNGNERNQRDKKIILDINKKDKDINKENKTENKKNHDHNKKDDVFDIKKCRHIHRNIETSIITKSKLYFLWWWCQ